VFRSALPLFEIALVLVRLDHVANIIVNGNQCICDATVILRICDCFIEYDALHRAKLQNHPGALRAAPNDNDHEYQSDCHSRS
jgi:hypothetical protein